MKGNVEPTFEQIVLYSKLLKLSLEEDADMLWMAETAYRDLPDNWKLGYDKKSDKVFFHNTRNGESSWLSPNHSVLSSMSSLYRRVRKGATNFDRVMETLRREREALDKDFWSPTSNGEFEHTSTGQKLSFDPHAEDRRLLNLKSNMLLRLRLLLSARSRASTPSYPLKSSENDVDQREREIDDHVSTKKGIDVIGDDETHKAATKVQAVARGRQARKFVDAKKNNTISLIKSINEEIIEDTVMPQPYQILEDKEALKAAVCIQSVTRGRQDRKKVNDLKSQKFPSTIFVDRPLTHQLIGNTPHDKDGAPSLKNFNISDNSLANDKTEMAQPNSFHNNRSIHSEMSFMGGTTHKENVGTVSIPGSETDLTDVMQVRYASLMQMQKVIKYFAYRCLVKAEVKNRGIDYKDVTVAKIKNLEGGEIDIVNKSYSSEEQTGQVSVSNPIQPSNDLATEKLTCLYKKTTVAGVETPNFIRPLNNKDSNNSNSLSLRSYNAEIGNSFIEEAAVDTALPISQSHYDLDNISTENKNKLNESGFLFHREHESLKSLTLFSEDDDNHKHTDYPVMLSEINYNDENTKNINETDNISKLNSSVIHHSLPSVVDDDAVIININILKESDDNTAKLSKRTNESLTRLMNIIDNSHQNLQLNPSGKEVKKRTDVENRCVQDDSMGETSSWRASVYEDHLASKVEDIVEAKDMMKHSKSNDTIEFQASELNESFSSLMKMTTSEMAPSAQGVVIIARVLQNTPLPEKSKRIMGESESVSLASASPSRIWSSEMNPKDILTPVKLKTPLNRGEFKEDDVSTNMVDSKVISRPRSASVYRPMTSSSSLKTDGMKMSGRSRKFDFVDVNKLGEITPKRSLSAAEIKQIEMEMEESKEQRIRTLKEKVLFERKQRMKEKQQMKESLKQMKEEEENELAAKKIERWEKRLEWEKQKKAKIRKQHKIQRQEEIIAHNEQIKEEQRILEWNQKVRACRDVFARLAANKKQLLEASVCEALLAHQLKLQATKKAKEALDEFICKNPYSSLKYQSDDILSESLLRNIVSHVEWIGDVPLAFNNDLTVDEKCLRASTVTGGCRSRSMSRSPTAKFKVWNEDNSNGVVVFVGAQNKSESSKKISSEKPNLNIPHLSLPKGSSLDCELPTAFKEFNFNHNDANFSPNNISSLDNGNVVNDIPHDLKEHRSVEENSLGIEEQIQERMPPVLLVDDISQKINKDNYDMALTNQQSNIERKKKSVASPTVKIITHRETKKKHAVQSEFMSDDASTDLVEEDNSIIVEISPKFIENEFSKVKANVEIPNFDIGDLNREILISNTGNPDMLRLLSIHHLNTGNETNKKPIFNSIIQGLNIPSEYQKSGKFNDGIINTNQLIFAKDTTSKFDTANEENDCNVNDSGNDHRCHTEVIPPLDNGESVMMSIIDDMPLVHTPTHNVDNHYFHTAFKKKKSTFNSALSHIDSKSSMYFSQPQNEVFHSLSSSNIIGQQHPYFSMENTVIPVDSIEEIENKHNNNNYHNYDQTRTRASTSPAALNSITFPDPRSGSLVHAAKSTQPDVTFDFRSPLKTPNHNLKDLTYLNQHEILKPNNYNQFSGSNTLQKSASAVLLRSNTASSSQMKSLIRNNSSFDINQSSIPTFLNCATTTNIKSSSSNNNVSVLSDDKQSKILLESLESQLGPSQRRLLFSTPQHIAISAPGEEKLKSAERVVDLMIQRHGFAIPAKFSGSIARAMATYANPGRPVTAPRPGLSTAKQG